jgi:hypothetical protein
MSAYTGGGIFNNSARIGGDYVDLSQQNIQNNRMLEAATANYFSNESNHDRILFMTNAGLMANGQTGGNGLSSVAVENETSLYWNTKNDKVSEDLMLKQRPFLTVPYLGRGSVDTNMESNIQRGEYIRNPKNGQPIGSMAALRMPEYYPIARPLANIDEDAIGLQGWQRGGVSSRAN